MHQAWADVERFSTMFRMEGEMDTMQSFIRSAGIKMSCDWADSNPHMPDSENMNHWKCLLRMGRSRMTVPFSQGYAHTGEPKIDDVLDCLASDASSIENAKGFDDWCADYGYDTDSRKAERTFTVTQRQAENLRKFLGDSAYETLLWHTERD
jgi:phage-related protein